LAIVLGLCDGCGEAERWQGIEDDGNVKQCDELHVWLSDWNAKLEFSERTKVSKGTGARAA
jgi:hypothetical protein